MIHFLTWLGSGSSTVGPSTASSSSKYKGTVSKRSQRGGLRLRCSGPSYSAEPLLAVLPISLLLVYGGPCFLFAAFDSPCFRHYLWANMHNGDIFPNIKGKVCKLEKKKRLDSFWLCSCKHHKAYLSSLLTQSTSVWKCFVSHFYSKVNFQVLWFL